MKSVCDQAEQVIYETELYRRIIANVVLIIKDEATKNIIRSVSSGAGDKILTFNEDNITRIALEAFLSKLLANFKTTHNLPYISQHLSSLEIQHVVAFEIAHGLLNNGNLKFTREIQGKMWGAVEHGVYLVRYLTGYTSNAPERNNRAISIVNLIPNLANPAENKILDYSVIFRTLHSRLKLTASIAADTLIGGLVTKEELVYENQFNTQSIEVSANDVKNQLRLLTGSREPHHYAGHFLDFTVVKRRAFYDEVAQEPLTAALKTLNVEVAVAKVSIVMQQLSLASLSPRGGSISLSSGSGHSDGDEQLGLMDGVIASGSFVSRLEESKEKQAGRDSLL
jgi:hypothetical protein